MACRCNSDVVRLGCPYVVAGAAATRGSGGWGGRGSREAIAIRPCVDSRGGGVVSHGVALGVVVAVRPVSGSTNGLSNGAASGAVGPTVTAPSVAFAPLAPVALGGRHICRVGALRDVTGNHSSLGCVAAPMGFPAPSAAATACIVAVRTHPNHAPGTNNVSTGCSNRRSMCRRSPAGAHP